MTQQPVRVLRWIVLAVLAMATAASSQTETYDLGVLNGTIIDGTGAAGRRANLYVRDGVIQSITPVDHVRTATKEIDAAGMVVTPGFIDTHAHGDPVRTPEFGNFLAMGVTTICLGQDGDSPADPAGWFQSVGKVKLGPNVALFAGHGTARNEVGIGNNPDPSPQQIKALQDWVRQAMQDGCLGLTTGLEYQPGSFAGLDELVAVARPVAEAGGVIMSHLRSEDDDSIAAALTELLEQGRQSQGAVHVSHLKVTYGHGAERAEKVLQQMQAARQAGQRVTADLYPYLASYTGIGIVFPDWAKPPHDYDVVVKNRRAELAAFLRQRVTLRNGPRSTLLATAPWTGKTLEEVAQQLDKPYEDVLMDDFGLNNDVKAAYFVMDGELQRRLLTDPHVMICSDGSPTMRHPRSYGAFARIIREFVSERQLLTLEQAVYKMSGLAAATTGLDQLSRGRIAEGYAADILVFDPLHVRDHATFEEPFQFATGFKWVIVNGQVVSESGAATGSLPGAVLKRAARPPANAKGPSLEEHVTKLLQPFTGDNVPGAAVMVIRNGQAILQKSVGMADVDQRVAIDARTNFRLASVTKQFTAMAIMQLRERNLLSYEDPLTTFFPGFPEIGKQITVRHLLWHTSGIIDYEHLMPGDQSAQLLDQDVLKLVQQQHGTYFTPGTEYRYSNTGYSLLALIVERVSGSRFAAYLEENIFAPLEMDNSVAYEEGVSTVPQRAFGFRQTDDGFVDADQSLTSAVLGDGGVYTSLEDYLKWDQALYTDRIVARNTLQQAFQAGHRRTETDTTGYGFGWRVEDRHGVRLLHHDGRTSGFNNAVRRVPEQQTTVVVLTNRAGSHAGEMADSILEYVMSDRR